MPCGVFLSYRLVMHVGKPDLVLDCYWAAAVLLSKCCQAVLRNRLPLDYDC